MKAITLVEHEDILNKLERAYYEVQGRQNIINFMIVNGMSENKNFQTYWDTYLCYLKVYENFKEEFRVTCVLPLVGENFEGNWEVDFNRKEVKIYD